MKNDPKIAIEYVKQRTWNFSDLNDKLKNDKNFMRDVVKNKFGHVVKDMGKDLRNDEEFMRELVAIDEERVLSNLSPTEKQKYKTTG
jgi:hypothetical protein